MAHVRKESSNSLEYVCPECGDTFEEGSEHCISCGLEFDWSEEMEYLCPECGTVVDPDQARCPGCGAKFSMHAEGELLIEFEPDAPRRSVIDMLEEAIDEVIIRPNGTIVEVEALKPPTGEGPSGEGPPSVGAGPDDAATGHVEKVEAVDPEDLPGMARLYPGGFTLAGLVFVVLAVMALLFTVVMARYDTWIQGASEESMGDNQRMMFYGGLAAFALFIVIAVADLLRTPRGRGTG